eukprot:CAMPEP_0170118388 /NCGR_PEP_ID=MMETSP0020_2-20130122/13684_1 /TAXON_ID=98059 /ORGANISM="Dinobryon sp., Strain UTEXLB2267" /LENGTH=371 /DNA_ID=CAMNT_0010347385 /DNA_START=2187 /DNA_END=3303 /DNA_ORIENTATION=-
MAYSIYKSDSTTSRHTNTAARSTTYESSCLYPISTTYCSSDNPILLMSDSTAATGTIIPTFKTTSLFLPTGQPSNQPLIRPIGKPSTVPTIQPTIQPKSLPSEQPDRNPTNQPSLMPVGCPTTQPSFVPFSHPQAVPTNQPSILPRDLPTVQPLMMPSSQPTVLPTNKPSNQEMLHPSLQPQRKPSSQPTSSPIKRPSRQPTRQPVKRPSRQPAKQPSSQPSRQPFLSPSLQPSHSPSAQPYSNPIISPHETTTKASAFNVQETALSPAVVSGISIGGVIALLFLGVVFYYWTTHIFNPKYAKVYIAPEELVSDAEGQQCIDYSQEVNVIKKEEVPTHVIQSALSDDDIMLNELEVGDDWFVMDSDDEEKL